MQVVAQGDLKLVEGGPPQFLEVNTNMPPEYMCANRTPGEGEGVCQVQVEILVGTGPYDDACIPGLTYPQVAVGYSTTGNK